ncbi:hypothetical protein C5167_028588 [Papaver somniferum]|nr:hypothetical protein C5167_028588 [Papaver somniferum]
MERVIQKMMDKEFEDRDDERIDVKLDAKETEAVEKTMHDDMNKQFEDREEKRIDDETDAKSLEVGAVSDVNGLHVVKSQEFDVKRSVHYGPVMNSRDFSAKSLTVETSEDIRSLEMG